MILAIVLVLGYFASAWADEREVSASSHPPLSEKKETPQGGYVVGGAVLTVLNIPLRGALCVGSTALAGGLYIVTLGTAVNATAFMVKETCGGPWIITPELVKGESSPRQVEP
jgi:hypothetical protein